MRLSCATSGRLPASVARPDEDAAAQAKRIVHLGIGAFHRAHQAVYTQEAGDCWRITGVSLRSPQVRDALMPQDGLYTVTERFSGSAATRLVTAIDTILVASEDPEAVIAALADPATQVVSLTVTEKGYYRHPAAGTLQRDDPAIADDLSGGAPTTIYGYLAQALARRRANGAGGVTLVSCDNLAGNGTLLMRLLGEFLDVVDRDLAEWTRAHVAAPDTMVDRIVPASTEADHAAVTAAIGMEDAAAIVTEPFRQWVIEDRFVGPRPRWEAAGAQIVADVAPFELAKLRLLNASHSTLAYVGLQLGHVYVHQAIADPRLHAFVTRQMNDEAVPCLTAAPGLDPTAYIAALLHRFANADLHHRLDQIAMDGSQKLPQRWLATMAARLAQGLDSPMHLTSLTAWIVYTEGDSVADDPLRDHYRAIWRNKAPDIGRVVERFVTELSVFPPELAGAPVFVAALTQAVAHWRAVGASVAVADILA
ncbi:mannitol dehydrogenase family protein [Sphingomonas zeae]